MCFTEENDNGVVSEIVGNASSSYLVQPFKKQRTGPLSSFLNGRVLALAPQSETRGWELAPGQLDDLESFQMRKYGKTGMDEVCSTSRPGPSAPAFDRPSSVAAYLRASETLGAHRVRPRKNAAESLENFRVSYLEERPLNSTLLQSLDKAFASNWLDDEHVLVGTKCNSLLCIESSTLRHRRLELPREPPRPEGYVIEPNPFGSCGIHTIATSPSGNLVATGGINCNDLAVLSVPQDKMAGAFVPVSTFVGHVGWLFDVSWLDDDLLVSASRDQTLKLWSVSKAAPACYQPLASADHHSRARAVKYDAETGSLTSLGTDGIVRLWDRARFTEVDSVFTGHTREVVCMAQQRHVIAVGSQSHVTLIDRRGPSVTLDVESIDQGHGVRSVALKDHLAVVGTGRGRLAFFDRRVNRYLDITREATPSDCPSTGSSPQSLGALAPTPAAPAAAAAASKSAPERQSFRYYQASEGWMEQNTVYRTHFEGMHVFAALYSLSWSPSGRKLFASGGPLAFGLRGCTMSMFG